MSHPARPLNCGDPTFSRIRPGSKAGFFWKSFSVAILVHAWPFLSKACMVTSQLLINCGSQSYQHHSIENVARHWSCLTPFLPVFQGIFFVTDTFSDHPEHGPWRIGVCFSDYFIWSCCLARSCFSFSQNIIGWKLQSIHQSIFLVNWKINLIQV